MPLADIVQTGFRASDAYEASRPGYTSEVVEKLLSNLEISGVSHANIADLAAGTGKFTEVLSRRKESYKITAIEPHDGMRLELQKKNLDRVTVVEGTAESMPEVADATQAAVIVAQAFHWFSNMNALKEISRVLQDRGVLGMIWNIEDYNSPKDWQIHDGWSKTMRDILWSLEDGHSRFRNMKWKEIFDEQGRSNPISLHYADPLFGLPIGEEVFDFTSWLSKDELWKRFKTLSQVAVLDRARLEEVENKFLEAIEAPETEKDEQGRIAVHGKVLIAWTSKIPSMPLKSPE